MPGTADTPFGPELPTIPLEHPPLAVVLAQIQFSPVLAIADEAFAGVFQQAIAENFPLAASETEVAVALAPVPSQQPQISQVKLWRFRSLDGGARVTLAPSFVAVETNSYSGHEQFLAQLEGVLNAVAEHVRPAQVQRTGIRYFQRLTEPEDLEAIPALFRPEIAGICSSDASANLELSLNQTRHVLNEIILTCRWGLLMPGVSPDIVPPVDQPSWIFDIDAFDEDSTPFDVGDLRGRLFRYSRVQYRFFRWAVELRFLERFGASAEDLANLEAAT